MKQTRNHYKQKLNVTLEQCLYLFAALRKKWEYWLITEELVPLKMDISHHASHSLYVFSAIKKQNHK